MKGSSSEAEEIKIRNCRIKIHVDIINEDTKRSISEEKEIRINKCRIRSRVDIINE